MKRLAYSLIGAALLWIVALAAFGVNLFDEHNDRLAAPPDPVGMYLAPSLVVAPVLIAVAGWILSGTSDPSEGIAYRVMVTFTAGLAGFLALGGLELSVYGLRSWLFSTELLPDINDR